ncbi:MAG: hypothetical protein PHV51_11470 [Methanosarcinaceae archaeon]|nr:hypothetical protein [Methanosarcinaceae archaeon]
MAPDPKDPKKGGAGDSTPTPEERLQSLKNSLQRRTAKLPN